MEISGGVLSLFEYVREHRRNLHKIPELALNEFKTQEYLYAELKNLGYKPKKVGTGLTVDIKGKENRKKTVAFRADMDALPIQECNDIDFKSINDGKMHACGHDGHMAMMLGFAKLLTEFTPKYNIRLIFQPAEENEGGAERMIEQGVLDDIGEIYALHLSPDYDTGILASDKGGILAGAVEHDVYFYGKKGHCADTPKKDAMAAGMFYFASITEKMKKYKNALLHLGKISGGGARNIVCDELKQEWTLRFFTPEDKEAITLLIAHTLNETNDKFATEHRFIVNTVYPPVINSTYAFMVAGNTAEITQCGAKFTAEDFAFYCEKTHGCLLWLGIWDENHTAPLHSEFFNFDEKALLYGIEFYKNLII